MYHDPQAGEYRGKNWWLDDFGQLYVQISSDPQGAFPSNVEEASHLKGKASLAATNGLGQWIWIVELPGANHLPYIYPNLFSVVLSSTPRRCFVYSLPLVGLLIMCIWFAIFVNLSVFPIDTTVLNDIWHLNQLFKFCTILFFIQILAIQGQEKTF